MSLRIKIISIFLFLNLNSIAQSDSNFHQYKEKNWFALLDKSSVLIGSGKLNFFGIELYDASLVSVPGTNNQNIFYHNFALALKYSKNFSKTKIADRSKKEILKLSISNKKDLDTWHQWMLKSFPDIKTGDVLTGVFSPKFGLKLFLNDNLIATNSDINFSKAFFSIWLSKKTSEPRLRNNLFNINK